MTAKIEFNPISKVVDIYNELYDTDVLIVWVEGLHKSCGSWGRTHFPDEENAQHEIEIDVNLPIEGFPEILGHELAHVVAGYDAGHNEEWEKVFDLLRNHYMKSIQEGYELP